MTRFVTEHKFQLASDLSPEELSAIARMFLRASDEVGRGFRWLGAYVTEDGVLSDCIAEERSHALEHAEKVASGELINVLQVLAVIDRSTAEG
jgi:hypothetical protein